MQQSLNPNEEIIRVGEFHWLYTFNAATWIVMGGIVMGLILYAGVYYDVIQTLNQQSDASINIINFWQQDIDVSKVIEFRGGIINVLQSMSWPIKAAAFIVFVLSLLVFAQKMAIKYTTEICLTTDRLVVKRGMVSRFVAEINIDRIEGVDVFQGILGRIMDFGYISVRGMGVGEIILPQIAEPIAFRQAIERSRSLKKGENI